MIAGAQLGFTAWLLVPIMGILLAIAGVACLEFYALASGRQPYTFYTRRLVQRHPALSQGVAVIVLVAVGWLVGHFFS